MPFAPNYNPTKDFSQDEAVNATGRSTVNTAALDAELANVEQSVNTLNGNLQKIQRDDDELRDYLIKPRMLSDATRALISGGWNPRGVWQPGVSYAVRDFVEHNAMCYVCALAHTSNTFSAEVSFWLGVSSVADVVALTERAETAAGQAAASAVAANNSANSAATSATNAANSADSITGSVTAAANSALLAEQHKTAAAASASMSTNSASKSAAARDAAQIAAASIDPSNLVHRTTDETISGVKTFTETPKIPAGDLASAVYAFSSPPQARVGSVIFVLPYGLMHWVSGLYRSIDCGSVILHPAVTPRTGTIKANGATLSKTTYAGLWSWAQENGLVVPAASWVAGSLFYADLGGDSFRLPDLRGMFLRAWDDGRGVDGGRTALSWQDGTWLRAIAQEWTGTDLDGGPWTFGNAHASPDAVLQNSGGQVPAGSMSPGGGPYPLQISDNASRANGYNDGFSAINRWIRFRPINTALTICIKF